MELTEEQQTEIGAQVANLRDRIANHEGRLPTREEAVALLFEHTKGESLRGHGLAVEASMAAYAQKTGADETLYRVVGLLHDFDYEANQDASQHPFVGCNLLIDLGYSRELIEAIIGHATYTGWARESEVAKTLFAVDELTGFLTAVAYMRPTGLGGLKFKSFKKKFKTRTFAAGVDREEVRQAAEEAGLDMQEHVLFLAEALQTAFPEFPRVAEAGV